MRNLIICFTNGTHRLYTRIDEDTIELKEGDLLSFTFGLDGSDAMVNLKSIECMELVPDATLRSIRQK